MEDEDLVVILANLLNNAIEACENCIGKKVIKFKFMMEISGTTIFDYTQEKMSSARATAIGQQVAEELVRRARAKDPVIDKDGTMMWVMAVQSGKYGKDAWTAFTKPEDYLKKHENDK